MTIAPPEEVEAAPNAMFSSLQMYNYRLYFFGQGASVAGNWMQNIAISWLVLQLTDSGTALGAITAARFVPLLLLGPWGGLVSDRSDKRRLLTITQGCSAVLSLILGVLSWLDEANIPTLLAIVISLGIVNVFDGPSRQSLINNLVSRERLANAIALNSIALNTSRIIGPAVGGALIATIGITPCFLVNALSFCGVIASLIYMREAELVPSEREVRSPGQIRAGFRYIRGNPTLLGSLAMIVVAGTFAWEFPVTLPLISQQTFHGNAVVYGLIMSCLGAGSIVGGLFAARRMNHSVRSLAVSAVLWGTVILAASVAPSLPFEYAAIALVGSAAVTFNSSAKTLLQLESRPQMRGRVMSIWSISWQGSTVIGAPVVGVVASLFGARYGLVLGGVTTMAVGVVCLASVARRRVDTTTAIADV